MLPDRVSNPGRLVGNLETGRKFRLSASILKTHFTAYIGGVAFIIISNKHILSLFLTSKDSVI